VDELWCLGDLVGYGAEPDACIVLAREHAVVNLAGNHDLAVCGQISLEEFSRGAALAATWTRDNVDPDNLRWLGELEPQAVEDGIGLYHASPRDPVWEYVLSTLLAELCLDAQRQRDLLHRPQPCRAVVHASRRRSGDRRDAGGRGRHRAVQGEWLINPGSVGQPRDGDPRAAWLLFDTATSTAATTAPTTTSRARRRRSGRPVCRTRSPSGCNTASDQPPAPV